MVSNKKLTPAQESWPQRQFVDTVTQLTLPALAVLIYSVVQLIIHGSQHNHYILMLIGSILSVLGAFVYIFASFAYGATGKKSILAMLCAFAGFIPYLFGCYLVFYQGFWGFKELSTDFSIWIVIKAVAAIFLGFRIVSSTYKITEIDKSVRANPEGLSPAEQLDNFLASHSSFGSAIKVNNSDEQLAFIDNHNPGNILNFIKSEEMAFKQRKYEIVHFENTVTGQNRTLYFEIPGFTSK
jgi:hypothetical protein